MTCIVGIIDKKGIYIGADSSVSAGNTQFAMSNNKKIFIDNDMIFGMAGDYAIFQEFQYRFAPPDCDTDRDPLEYMLNSFAPALREQFETVFSGDNEFYIMIGFRGRLFQLDKNYAIIETSLDFDAIGSGEDIARGVLFATPDLSPQERIKLALTAAERFTCFVRKPFIIKFLHS